MVEQYLRQVRTYVSNDGTVHELRQITNQRSAVIRVVEQLSRQAEAVNARSLADIQIRLEDGYAATVLKVEDTFVRLLPGVADRLVVLGPSVSKDNPPCSGTVMLLATIKAKDAEALDG